MKAIIFASFVLFLLLTSASKAERADALKPVNVDFVRIHLDNATHATIATGKVIITRGTMTLKSERAEVKKTPDGYRTFTLIGTTDKLATFRAKSDGGPDRWSEGHAERIEYDERADTVKLFSKAMIRQLEDGRITHQMEQSFISYGNPPTKRARSEVEFST
jgi:lipopolysaccharide export system protein LptA